MDQMDPHWQTTDEQEVPVRITSSKPQRMTAEKLQVPAAKRSPAALFGIAMIVLAGFFAFGGMDIFPAQIAESTVDAVITDVDVVPPEIRIRAGQRIKWTNASGIPHILASETLMDDKGKKFESTAIFPGSDVTFDVPASTPAGEYEYVSKTSPAIGGKIIVEAQVTTMTPVTTTSAASSNSTPSFVPVAAMSSSSAVSTIPNDDTTIDSSGIPVNPYTVGNSYAGTTVTKNPATAAVTTHRPITNTESGAGIWLAIGAGLLALVSVMRKASLKA